MPLAAYGHIAAGAVAMILGAFQVNAMIRQRSLTRHRWLGRVYVAAVLIGAPSGLALATVSEGGMVTHVAFGLLAVLWFGDDGDGLCARSGSATFSRIDSG